MRRTALAALLLAGCSPPSADTGGANRGSDASNVGNNAAGGSGGIGGAPPAAGFDGPLEKAVEATAPLDGSSEAAGEPDAARDQASADVVSGPAPNPAIDRHCTPAVQFTNMVPNSLGGRRFATSIPDPVANVQSHSRALCRLLFRDAAEIRDVPTITLIIDVSDGVAYTIGNETHFSANYIGSLQLDAAALTFELNGVLAHELTHVWQNNRGGGGSLIEAMADYARFRVGFDRIQRRRRGGNWSDSYTTGGFFLLWVEDTLDHDWGYKVNRGMSSPSFSYPAFIMETFGKTADALWAEYQAAI